MSGSVLSSFAAKTDSPRQVGKEGGGPMAWVGKWVLALSLTASFGLSTFSRAGTGEDALEEVRLAFSPYRQGPPRVDGLSPGTTLTHSTWQAAVGVLPPEILRLLQAGELAITVQETTDSPLPEAYVEATLKGVGQVNLGDNGELKNYVAGLPFPLLDPSDPQAGLKAAWNLRYRNLGESVEARYTVALRDHTGATQRSLEFQHVFLYGLHRAESDANLAEWEKEGVFFKEYVHALAPLDLAGFQQIRLHYDRDALADEEWGYDPRTRRVRKTAYNPLTASAGLNYLTEDRIGFLGYLHPYEWQFRGRQVVLAPWAIKAEQAHFGGKGGWYPIDPWELRAALVLECRPRDANHPYGKRVFYLDAQTYAILYVLVYDRQGNHFRTFFLCYSNPAFSPRNTHVRVPLFAGESWIDHEAQVAAVLTPKQIVYNQPLGPKLFTVENLLRQGK